MYGEIDLRDVAERTVLVEQVTLSEESGAATPRFHLASDYPSSTLAGEDATNFERTSTRWNDLRHDLRCTRCAQALRRQVPSVREPEP